jgi:methionyl-tRNA formyltransferase
MHQSAERLGLPVSQPDSVNTPEFLAMLEAWQADLLVVADFGQILSSATLRGARLGGINVHGSLLPKYRGAAPIAWAIYHGEEQAGVSIIQMTTELDAGGVLLQEGIPIEPQETAGQLESRLAILGADLAERAVDLLESGKASIIPQDQDRATKAPRLRKEDGRIDWARSARQIHLQVRAMSPWPIAYAAWPADDRPEHRLQVIRTETVEGIGSAQPGEVVGVGKGGLVVATGEGGLRLIEVRPAGRKGMSGEEFARGARLQLGSRLG